MPDRITFLKVPAGTRVNDLVKILESYEFKITNPEAQPPENRDTILYNIQGPEPKYARLHHDLIAEGYVVWQDPIKETMK